MKTLLPLLLLGSLAVTAKASDPADELPPAPQGKSFKLVWHDEFDGDRLDEAKWTYRPDGKRKGGWWSRKAISLDGEGHLVITTFMDGDKPTDGCITTQGKFEHAFGYDNYSHDDSLQTDWGFACLITGSEKTILFDTGGKGDLLLTNMKKMNLSSKDVDLIVISHNHGDHTGGLLPFLKENPDVGVFLPAKTPDGFVKEVQQVAANVTVVNKPTTICDGAVVLGPMGDQIIEQALVLDTSKGLVIVTGCSHPGIEVIAKKAKAELHRDIQMVLGGTHLLRHSDDDLQAVIDTLQKLGVQRVAPTHCSGDKAISMFREAFGDGFEKVGVGRVIEIDGE
jgi:7,8-dihydropterin-6-yl-methyl-4-(beta-D-ribofuranosyl)aminobenzene 5'-phosphate synthase